ncbi:hypothetical protein [Euzebya tangerina]|uniref:hypothetical protein n=1 Tax=Euzebya tangerina TaxID=591198 RepID=UPI0013C2F93A|nr:hypothetical protein [Euzebya tangerina]
MTRRWRIGAVVVASLLAVTAAVFLGPVATRISVGAVLASGLLYLLSHVLRAMRLAALSVDMLGVSGRTAATVHLVTTPPSLVLPFKSGELLRFHELWRLGGTAIYAVVVLLLDRMFDSLFLVPVLLVLLAQDAAPALFGVLIALAAIVPLTVVFVGPRLLGDVQRYVLLNHNSAHTLSVLRSIDTVRQVVVHGAEVARRRGPELCVLSLLIWLLEFTFCWLVIVAAGGGGVTDSLLLLGQRQVAYLGGVAGAPAVRISFAIALLAVLTPWPVVTGLYLLRRGEEPRRPPALARMRMTSR